MARAGTYVHGHPEAVLRAHGQRTARNSAAYLLSDLRSGISVLDVGCGPGTITADIAELVAPGHVTAIDPAEGARRATSHLCAGRGLDVTVGGSDVHTLDFADGSFDVVHAHQVLQHLADPVLALQEMRRVCRPGGVVAARDADYAAMTWYPDVPALDDWLATYRRTARAAGGEPDAGRRLLSWALQAGFTDITPTASTWCYATPEERAWYSQTWAVRVTGSPFAAHAVAHGFATDADLGRMADEWRRWGAEPSGWFTIVHGEIRCVV